MSALSGIAARCSTPSLRSAVTRTRKVASEALPHAPASAQASAPPPTVAPAAEAAGEHRYLTVMFCDLVDFDRHCGAANEASYSGMCGGYDEGAPAVPLPPETPNAVTCFFRNLLQ